MDVENYHKKRLRSLLICILLATSCITLWLPMIIQICIVYFKGRANWVLINLSLTFVEMNSICDPTIYIMLNGEIKSEYKTYLKKLKCKIRKTKLSHEGRFS